MPVQIFGVKELQTTLTALSTGIIAQNDILQRIAVALESGAVGGGSGVVSSKVYLLDDDGNYLLDDSGKRLYIDDSDSWLTGEITTTEGIRHFIPVDTGVTVNLLPGVSGKYYKLTSLVLSGTTEITWKLKDGNIFKTGYPCGDMGFGLVISLPENLFETTPGNPLTLEITGTGNVLGHVIAYEYAS